MAISQKYQIPVPDWSQIWTSIVSCQLVCCNTSQNPAHGVKEQQLLVTKLRHLTLARLIIFSVTIDDHSENKEGLRLLSRAGGINSTREISPWQIQGLLLCSSSAVMGGIHCSIHILPCGLKEKYPTFSFLYKFAFICKDMKSIQLSLMNADFNF